MDGWTIRQESLCRNGPTHQTYIDRPLGRMEEETSLAIHRSPRLPFRFRVTRLRDDRNQFKINFQFTQGSHDTRGKQMERALRARATSSHHQRPEIDVPTLPAAIKSTLTITFLRSRMMMMAMQMTASVSRSRCPVVCSASKVGHRAQQVAVSNRRAAVLLGLMSGMVIAAPSANALIPDGTVRRLRQLLSPLSHLALRSHARRRR